MCAAMALASHFTNPTWLRPSASATRVANQASVFQAALFATTSSQVTTPVMIISAMTTKAAAVGSIYAPPKIHSNSATTTRIARMISFRVIGPIFCSSDPAHFGTSSPDLTSGG